MSALANVASEDQVSIDFCTLGMFIIDEIHFRPPTPPVFNVLGGAGSYSALGARLLSPPPLSKSVGWIVDAGSDFPAELREIIAKWQTSCLLRETPSRLTTRAWNGYGENEKRAFKYTTEKLRLDHNSLTSDLLLSKSFHLISSPSRCLEQIRGILERRVTRTRQRPIFIWEPVPDLCVSSELQRCLYTLKHVDVVSPNHNELCAFIGRQGDTSSGSVDTETVEECCKSWLASGVGKDDQGLIVVRAGAYGCLVASRQSGMQWMPSYHEDASKVIDPTGGGNAFLGGLAVGLVRSKGSLSLTHGEEAAAWGSIAASFAIEQVGMPKLERKGEKETWNDSDVLQRLDEYKRRLRNVYQ